MNDGENEYEKRVQQRRRQEIEEYENSERAKLQKLIDFNWQVHLDTQAINRARALSGEDPQRGSYNPLRRFDSEMDDAQSRADNDYWRGRRR
jgi:hypothetical protein